MGKKSLIKSTSKKKRAPKKAAASKNPKKKKAPAKKAAPKGAKPAAKAKAAPVTVKKAAAKKPAPKAKPVSLKELLKKQFDSPAPKKRYTVPADKVEKSTFTAPDLLAGFSAADAKRIRGLLANTYSDKDLKAAAKKPAPKAKPVSREELIKKQFDRVVPGTLYTVPAAMVEKSTFSAPERTTGLGADDAKRVKSLLSNTYSEEDLKAAAEKAAAEKAAAEKAAAEKAAAEKAAAEKAAAEKAAAEKAAAEKAAAEKAAAEKAAAEKAAAEKAAAEKAAAEKAAAEKAAAEKAAAEKAAAEKAAAEKAAAEKAAAEKAANEKAALEKAEEIRKAAAQKSEVEVSYASKPAAKPAEPKKPADPVDNTIKLIAACVAFFMLLVVGASISNSTKYYLAEKQGALEIWKGKFAPLGKKLIVSLPGVPAPETMEAVYSADDVYPLAFDYYIEKADALLDVSGIPDFESIKATLKTALAYGSTTELKQKAYARLDTIDRIILTYKADVAASRGTIEDLVAAIGFLSEAAKLTTDPAQKEMINQSIAAHEATIIALEEAAAAEQAALEAQEAEAAAMAEESDAPPEATEGEETAPAEAAPEAETEGHDGH